MYQAIKKATLKIKLRFAYREKLRNLKQRMKKLNKKERRVDALILRWEDKVNTAMAFSDKASQESELLWAKLRNVVHDLALISGVPRSAADIKTMVHKHVESTRKELMN